MESKQIFGRKRRECDAVDGPPLKRKNLYVEYLTKKNQSSCGRKLLQKNYTDEKLKLTCVYIKQSEEALCIKAWKNNNVLSLCDIPQNFTKSISPHIKMPKEALHIKKRKNNNGTAFSDSPMKKFRVSVSRKASKEDLLFAYYFRNFDVILQDAIRCSIMAYCIMHKINSKILFGELQQIYAELFKYPVKLVSIIKSCISDKMNFEKSFHQLKQLAFLKCVVSLQRLDEDIINLAIKRRSVDKQLIRSKNETFRNLENTCSDISERGTEENETSREIMVSRYPDESINSPSEAEEGTDAEAQETQSLIHNEDTETIWIEASDSEMDSDITGNKAVNKFAGSLHKHGVTERASLLREETIDTKGIEMEENESDTESTESGTSDGFTDSPNEAVERNTAVTQEKKLLKCNKCIETIWIEASDNETGGDISGNRADGEFADTLYEEGVTEAERTERVLLLQETIDTKDIQTEENESDTEYIESRAVDKTTDSPYYVEEGNDADTQGRQPLKHNEDIETFWIEESDGESNSDTTDNRAVDEFAKSHHEAEEMNKAKRKGRASLIQEHTIDMKGNGSEGNEIDREIMDSRSVDEATDSTSGAEEGNSAGTHEKQPLKCNKCIETIWIQTSDSEMDNDITANRADDEFPESLYEDARVTEAGRTIRVSLLQAETIDTRGIEIEENESDAECMECGAVDRTTDSPYYVEEGNDADTHGKQSLKHNEDIQIIWVEANNDEANSNITDNRAVDEFAGSLHEAEEINEAEMKERASLIQKQTVGMRGNGSEGNDTDREIMDRRFVYEPSDLPYAVEEGIDADTQETQSLKHNEGTETMWIEAAHSHMYSDIPDNRAVDEYAVSLYEHEEVTEDQRREGASLLWEETLDPKGIEMEENGSDTESMENGTVDGPTDSPNEAEDRNDAETQETEPLKCNGCIETIWIGTSDSETGSDISGNRADDEFSDSLYEDEGVTEAERTERAPLLWEETIDT